MQLVASVLYSTVPVQTSGEESQLEAPGEWLDESRCPSRACDCDSMGDWQGL